MSIVVEAEVSFGDAKITIRGPQEFVQSEVTRLAGLAQSRRLPSPADRNGQIVDDGPQSKVAADNVADQEEPVLSQRVVEGSSLSQEPADDPL